MSTLGWIILTGLAMCAIAVIGVITLALRPESLERLLIPLVAFAAGSLIGGALFHMLPAAIGAGMSPLGVGTATAAGFTVFFLLEELLHWRHCQRPESAAARPLTYLVLIGDGLHNFLGGLAIGSAFLVDVRLGLTSWLAAAAHEIPQELGDFGVLVHSGWSRRRALVFNVLSALTFLGGGLVAYALSRQVNVSLLIPFAAGNFLYIAASDLVPEINRQESSRRLHVAAFLLGLIALFIAALALP
jgi:zinc and cadmium transporter